MRNQLVHVTKAAKVAALSVVIALAGCASLGAKTTPEEQVKARAQERRDAMVKRDYGAVYNYFTPTYRKAVPLENFRSSIGNAMQITGATVESVKCEMLEKCIAQVKVEMKPLAAPRFTGTITTYSEETWLLESGQWWYFQRL